MLSERVQSRVMRALSAGYLNMQPVPAKGASLPPFEGASSAGDGAASDIALASGAASAQPHKLTPPAYLLYAHIPFCERLCPYCSFCRYPFNEAKARAYFAALREEMRMVARLGYPITSLYIGGGTPTILADELAASIDLARELFAVKEVSCETNPNHLTPAVLDTLEGRVQRLSVGVQSFDNGLLARMQRLEKYGSGPEIYQRLTAAAGRFVSLNADMIFNFPTQTEDILINDLAHLLESGVSQTTFYPLMASPAVERQLAATLGRVDYAREARYYAIICEALTNAGAAAAAPYEFGSAWTFNASSSAMIDEYIVNYEEYPAIGAGGFSYLGGTLYANTFSVDDYIKRINAGGMSVAQRNPFSQTSQMRYRLMMQLFGLELDKQQWRRSFGVSVAAGLPAEYAFFKAVGAFDEDSASRITLTPKGRYLLVALMREFFVGVNGLRDLARASLPAAERELLFNDS